MTEFVRVHPGVPIQMEMSPNVANVLYSTLLAFAERCRRFDWTFRQRMFPDVAPDPVTFRRRNHGPMHQAVLGATGRVLAAWAGHHRVRLAHTEVDDWFIVLAHARWMYTDRHAEDVARLAERGVEWAAMVSLLQLVQQQLCSAAVPGLSRGRVSYPGKAMPTQ